MGRRPIPRQRGLFVKSPLWNPEKQRLTFIAWIVILCSQGIKRPAYTPPIRLRRRDALDQHNARLTRKTRPSAASSYQAVFMGRRPIPRQRGLFVKSPLWNPEKQRLTFIVWIFSICSQDIKDHRTCRYPPSASRCARSAHREINPQNTAFGCKQLSGCIHGAPPHTPPKGTFCKKSPLESRKTAFDFYCLDCHPLLPRYQKAGVHAAYSPSASRCARSAHREINPQNTAFGCKQLSGCIHGAPPHTPPKGTFCKKSPLESRKTAFDFYCLDCHPLLPRYQKAGVHAAYSPSASRCA